MNISEMDPMADAMETPENEEDTRLKRSLPTRNYTCQVCFAATTSAKQHLRHLVEAHGQNLSIYECDMCEYATRWKHKLPRHIKCHYTSISPRSKSPSSTLNKSPKMVSPDKQHLMAQAADRDVLLFQKIQTSTATKPSDLGIDYEQDDSWMNQDIYKQENHEVIPSENQEYLRPTTESQGRIKKPPVREAVDPNKYVELDDPVNGTRYSCSVCGNVYKWRKSLNKHWKDKHEKEIGSMSANRSTVLNVPKVTQVKQPLLNMQHNTTPNIAPNVPPPSVYRSKSPEEEFSFSKYERQYGSSSVLYGDGPSWINEAKDPRRYEEGYDLEPGEKLPTVPREQKTYPPHKAHSTSLLQALSTHKFANGQTKGIAKPKPVYPTPIRIKQEPDFYGYPDNPSVMNYAYKPVVNKDGSKALEVLDLSSKSSPVDLTEESDWTGISLKNKSQAYQSEPLNLCMKKPTKDNQENFTDKDIQEENNNYAEDCTLPSEELQCSKCAYISRDQSDYNKHMEMHLPTRTQKCGECRAVFHSIQELNNHFATHHEPLVQNEEDSSLYESKKAEEHLCHLCDAVYQSDFELVRHFEIMHPNIPIPSMKKCPSSSASDAQEVKRAKTTPTWESGSELMKHLLPRTTEGLYECTACPFTARTEGQMAVHMKNLHHLPMKPNTGLQEDSEQNEHSSVVFPEKIAVSVSPLNINTEVGENMSPTQLTPSSQCSSLSPRSRSGNSEMLLPYKCSVCEYRARWPSEITQHMKNHSDEKPYLCPGCPYRSKWKWDVVKHMKRCKDALGGSIDDVIDTTGSIERRRRKYAPRKKISPVEDFDLHKPLSRGPPNVVVVPHSDTPKSAYVHEGGQQQAKQYPSITKRLEMQPDQEDETAHDVDKEIPMNLSSMSRMGSNYDREAQFERDMGDMESDSDDVKSELESHLSNSGSYGMQAGNAEVGLSYGAGNSRPNSLSGSPGMNKSKEKLGQIANQHPCRYCPFVGQSPAELKRHSAVHSDQKPFSCDDCDYRTKWKCDLKKHMRIYNHQSNCVGLTKKRKMGPCFQQGTYSPQRIEYSHPSQELQLLKCDKCEYVSYKKTALESHQRIHQNKASKSLKCRQCGYEANDLPSFLQHNLSHVTDNKSIDDNDDKDQIEKSVNFTATKMTGKSATLKHRRKPMAILVCSKCPYTCNKKAKLQLHKSMHGNRGASAIQCHYCDYSVFSTGLLKQHMSLHEEYRADVTSYVNGEVENKLSDKVDSVKGSDGLENDKVNSGKNDHNKDIKCDWCPFSASNPLMLYEHVQDMHKLKTDLPCEELENNEDEKIEESVNLENAKDFQESGENGENIKDNIGQKREELIEENNNTVKTCSVSNRNLLNSSEEVMETSGEKNDKDMSENIKSQEGANDGTENIQKDSEQAIKENDENKNTGDTEAHETSQLPDMTSKDNVEQMDAEKVDCDAVNESSNSEIEETENEVSENGDDEIEPGEIIHGVNSLINGRKNEFMIHQCSHCPFVTREVMFFNRHLEMHEYKGRFTCRYCNYSLDKLNFLVKHMKVHSDSYIESTECIEEQENLETENETQINVENNEMNATSSSRNAEKYQELIARLKENSSYDCLGPAQVAPLAGTQFDTQALENMKNSLYKKAVLGLSSRSRIVYRCALCPFTSGSKSNMNKHRNAHLIKNKYQCTECSYSARKWTLLQWHQKSHREPEKPVGQEQCRYITIHLDGSETEEATPLERMNTHENYYRESENYRDFSDSEEMYDSMSVHIPETVEGYHKGMECFKDGEAEASTVRSLLLAPQLNLLRPIAPKPVNMGASSMAFLPLKKKKKTRYHCEKCPYGSNSLFEYQKHTQLHGSPLRYRCDYCDYSLNRMNLMFQHRRLHADEPGFKRTPPPTELINKNVQDNSFRFKVNHNQSPSFDMAGLDSVIDEKDEMVTSKGYIQLSDGYEAMDFSMKSSANYQEPSSYFMQNTSCSQQQRLAPYGDPRSNTSETELKRVSRIMTVTVEGKKRPKVWKMYKCPQCPFSCGSKQGYGIHESLHGSNGRYKCDECSYSVNRLNLLLQHSKLHMGIPKSVKINNGKKPLKCPKCPFRTHSPSILSSHLRMHTSGGKYTCQFCDYGIDRYNLIKQHMKIHFTYSGDDSNCEIVDENQLQPENDEPKLELKCERCPFQTGSEYLYSKHTDGHMKEYSYKCKHCDYSCDESVEIIHHTQLHFTGNEQTSLDLREVSQDVKGTYCNDEESDHYNEDDMCVGATSELMCQYCDRVFSNQQQLQNHEQMHLVGCE